MSKEEFEQAFREVISKEVHELSEEADSIICSERFYQKMNRLVRKQKQFWWRFINTPGKKVLIAAAILMIIFATAFCFAPIREAITGFFVTEHDDHITISNSSSYQEVRETFTFGKIPKGFSQVDTYTSDSMISTVYQNGAGEQIILDQILNAEYEMNMDNENSSIWEEKVGDLGVKFYESQNLLVASWSKNGYVLMLYCYGEIDRDYMISLIQDVELRTEKN